MMVVAGAAVHEPMQPDGQRVKSFRGSGRTFDNDQRRFLGAQHQTFLHEDLPDVARRNTERIVVLIFQTDDFFAVKSAERGMVVIVACMDVKKLIGRQGRNGHASGRFVEAEQIPGR